MATASEADWTGGVEDYMDAFLVATVVPPGKMPGSTSGETPDATKKIP